MSMIKKLASRVAQAVGTMSCTLALTAAAASSASAANMYLQGVTAPMGGIWVEDGIGPAHGHLWIADHLQGFCRLNPNADNSGATLLTSSCKPTGDGQPAWDPINRLAYSPDGSAKSVGVMRLKLGATSGLFNGGQTNFNNALPVADSRCKGNTLGGCRPTAVAFVRTNGGNGTGNGDLYIAVKRNGNIYRIRNVANGSPGISGSPSPLQLVGQTSDGVGAQSLAFVGNDLYIAEGAAVTVIQDPSNLNTGDGLGLCNSTSGRGVCVGEDAGFGFLAPLSVGSDGRRLFVGDASNPLQAVNVVNFDEFGTGTPTPFEDGGFYLNVSGFAFAPEFIDPVTNASRPARLYWGDDATAGASILQGHFYFTEASNLP